MGHTVYYYFDKKGYPRNDVYLDGNKYINSSGHPINIKRCTIEEYEDLVIKRSKKIEQIKLF